MYSQSQGFSTSLFAIFCDPKDVRLMLTLPFGRVEIDGTGVVCAHSMLISRSYRLRVAILDVPWIKGIQESISCLFPGCVGGDDT